jgi:hypothetical protein
MWNREFDMVFQKQPKITPQGFGRDGSCQSDLMEETFHITKTGNRTHRQHAKMGNDAMLLQL